MRQFPKMAATNLSQNPVPVPQNPASRIANPNPESLIGAGLDGARTTRETGSRDDERR